MNEKELEYWIWFLKLEKINSFQKEYLLKKYNSPKNIWNLSKNELNQLENQLSEESVKDILCKKNRINLKNYIIYMKKNNIKLITIYDEKYPEKLKNIYDKPIAIFCKGNIDLLNEQSISIVGSRYCSLYGRKIAYKLAKDLSLRKKCIISGIAKGIDGYAHIGALSVRGNTIAVLAHGLDMIYPIENKKIYDNIIKNNGLIISEYVIGEKPKKIYFPARNRIISALSDGIIVVEASKKSGALITVDFGIEQGKNIFAVPGNIDTYNSEGVNNLIKEGAYVVTDVNDVIEVCYGITK